MPSLTRLQYGMLGVFLLAKINSLISVILLLGASTGDRSMRDMAVPFLTGSIVCLFIVIVLAMISNNKEINSARNNYTSS